MHPNLHDLERQAESCKIPRTTSRSFDRISTTGLGSALSVMKDLARIAAWPLVAGAPPKSEAGSQSVTGSLRKNSDTVTKSMPCSAQTYGIFGFRGL